MLVVELYLQQLQKKRKKRPVLLLPVAFYFATNVVVMVINKLSVYLMIKKVVCYFCYGIGHYASDCPSKMKIGSTHVY